MTPFLHPTGLAIRLAHPDEETVHENLPMTPTTMSDDEEESHCVVLTGPSTPKNMGSPASKSSPAPTAAVGIIETPTQVLHLKPDGKMDKKKKKKKKNKMKKEAKAKEDEVKKKEETKKKPEDKLKEKKKKVNIVARFTEYFGPGTLEDWQRLCEDLSLEGEFSSKNQCRKVSPFLQHANLRN